MTINEKIDYMIVALQLAKEELDYKNEYIKLEKENDEKYANDVYKKYDFYKKHRTPNKTVIRENLAMVGRIGFILAKDVK